MTRDEALACAKRLADYRSKSMVGEGRALAQWVLDEEEARAAEVRRAALERPTVEPIPGMGPKP